MIHLQGTPGRPIKPISAEETKAVLDVHDRDPAGVLRTVKNLGSHISHRRVYHIMKANGLVIPSPAKVKKRKWVRYDRRRKFAHLRLDIRRGDFLGPDLRTPNL